MSTRVYQIHLLTLSHLKVQVSGVVECSPRAWESAAPTTLKEPKSQSPCLTSHSLPWIFARCTTAAVGYSSERSSQLVRIREIEGIWLKTLSNLYKCTVQSMPIVCFMSWFINTNTQDWGRRQKMKGIHLFIMGTDYPTIKAIYWKHCKKANIIKDWPPSALHWEEGTGAEEWLPPGSRRLSSHQ